MTKFKLHLTSSSVSYNELYYPNVSYHRFKGYLRKLRQTPFCFCRRDASKHMHIVLTLEGWGQNLITGHDHVVTQVDHVEISRCV